MKSAGLALVCLIAGAAEVRAQGTAFTYQGRLDAGAKPVNGSYDLCFALYDTAEAGAQAGLTCTNAATPVSNGLFVVTLDFGNQFTNGNRWLEIGVRTNGAGIFEWLKPRQPLTPVPNAVAANVAGQLAGTIPAAQITGTILAAQLPAAVLTHGQTGVFLSGHFSGNGASLTNLNAATLSGLPASSFASNVFNLMVETEGSGAGTVTTSPSGMTGATNGVARYAPGTVVTLTAIPDSNSLFLGWSGASGGTNGTVIMDGPKYVKALFQKKAYVLTVTRTGGGVVVSSVGGLYCGAVCSVAVDAGTSVTLTATPEPGAVFAGWSGAASGTSPTCTLTMDSAKAVVARFMVPLTVLQAGAGAGTVASSPAGINCGATCAAAFDAGSQVTLTATANSISTFTGWTGDISSPNATVVVTLDQAKSVIANFALITYPLTVTRTEGGTVTSSAGGLYCGAVCAVNVTANSTVTLTATPEPGYTFAGWGGAASGSLPTCAITMNAAKSVSATFTGSPVFAGSVTASNFVGNGSGLTHLDAARVQSGTLADARLSTNVALLGAQQTFTATNHFAGTLLATNVGNQIAGTFVGDGAGLTGLNANHLASGTVPLAQIPAAVVTNGAANLTLAGTFTGNGSGLSAVDADLLDGQHGVFYQNASNLNAGTVGDARLSANVPLLNSNQVFTATNIFAGVAILTNAGNAIHGTFTGNLAGNADTASTATTAGSFTGMLSGDVTGPQGATVIGSVGGQTAVNVASGASAANAATSAATPNTLVKRDATGSLAAMNLTLAGTISGNGGGLTNLNANHLASGTLPAARLSANVPLLNASQTFSGTNTFAADMRVSGLLRLGSETNSASDPYYPAPNGGLLLRRITSVNQSSAVLVARTDTLQLQRDGTDSGLQLAYTTNSTYQSINATGITTNGTLVVYRNTLRNPTESGTLVIFSNAQRVVHYDISFGGVFSRGHTCHVILDRYDDGAISDRFMVGTLTSTYNQ